MRSDAKILCLCLTALLLVFSLSSCRNRDFTPAIPPADEENGEALPADFQCWVRVPDGTEYPLRGDSAAEIYRAVRKVYERSDTAEAFPDKEGRLLLVFCTGGTAPEAGIPAYQLPNSTLYGVYTLFPDDTGRYGDNLITAHIHSFKLKAGSYESLRELAEAGDLQTPLH